MRHYIHVRVVGVERLLRGDDLSLPDVVGLVEDLALKVRSVDDIEVDDADPADAGEREVECHGRTEPAGADDQHARFDDLALPGAADLRHDQVAAVALDHLRGEHGRGAAGEGGDDRHFVAVADRGGLALEAVDFDLVHVDVDVLGELPIGRQQLGAEAGELAIEVLDDVADGAAGCADVRTIADEVPERGGDVNGDGQWTPPWGDPFVDGPRGFERLVGAAPACRRSS